MRTVLAVPLLLASAASAPAHRLDEYLQATLISVAKNQLQLELTLTPGVAVFPIVVADIDTDRDGIISPTEQQAYTAHVLRDLSLTVDGRAVTPHLLSLQFPSIDEFKVGLGEIRIAITADLPRGGSSRRLIFENRHESQLGAYLVNCLVPRDPAIQILVQKRNYSQSHYELDYTQTSDRSRSTLSGVCLAAIALLLAARFAFLWRRRSRLEAIVAD